MHPPTRRSVLKSVGLGTAGLVAGVGTAAAEEDHSAHVRVAHLAPDAPAVDIYVDADPGRANPAVAGVAFTNVTDYLELSPGKHAITVTAADSTEPVAPTPVTVELEDDVYTAAAVGELSPEGDEPAFSLDVVEVHAGDLADGMGRVRAYHAVPDAPVVDVSVVDGPQLAGGLAFGHASANSAVEAGTYTIAVYPTDGDEPVLGPVDVEVRAGQALTVFATGNLEPEGEEPEIRPVLAYSAVAAEGGLAVAKTETPSGTATGTPTGTATPGDQ